MMFSNLCLSFRETVPVTKVIFEQVGPLLGVPVDLFSPLEQRLCPLLMGAVQDPDNKKKDK